MPSNEKTDMNLPSPTGLLTTEFLLGTCFLYKILAPQGEGKGRYCPPSQCVQLSGWKLARLLIGLFQFGRLFQIFSWYTKLFLLSA